MCRRPRLDLAQRSGRHLRIAAAAFVVAWSCAGSSNAKAQSPLDPTFGEGGALSFSSSESQILDLTVPESGPRAGQIVAVGGQFWEMVHVPFIQVRDSNGSVVPGGMAEQLPLPTTAGVGGQGFDGVDVARDGKIVVVGRHRSYNTNDLFVARFGLDGSLDTDSDADPGVAFGPGGQGFVRFSGDGIAGTEVRLVRDGPRAGDVMVAGFSGGWEDSFQRYRSVGTLTRLSDSGGILWTRDFAFGPAPNGSPASISNTAAALELDPDGDVVVAGIQGIRYSNSGATPDDRASVGLVRFGPDGTRDTGFGTSGLASFPREHVYDVSLAVDDLQRPLIEWNGSTEAGVSSEVARLSPAGSLDQSFGEGGITRLGPEPVSGIELSATSEIGARGDRVYATGSAVLTGDRPRAFAVVSLLPNGGLDPDFGEGGVAVADRPEEGAIGTQIAFQEAGIVTAGNWSRRNYLAPAGNVFARFRYDGGHTDDGGAAGGVAASGRGLRVHKVISPRTLPKLFASGVRALVSCEQDCRAILEVKVRTGAADEMGLSSRVVARGSRVLDAGKRLWVIAKLTGQARRALRTYTGGGRFKVSAKGVAP